MEDERKEKLEYFEGQFMLTGGEIADLMAEEEKELKNLKDENKIAFIKRKLEKYEELFSHLDEVEEIIAELKEQLES
jgi:phage-related minor tail protein